MDVSPIQVLLIFIVAFIAGIDQFSFLESLYQPIVTGFLVGLILGDVQTGLIVGGTYQLMTIGNMPVGGAQPPNAVIGGIMSAVFAITTKQREWNCCSYSSHWLKLSSDCKDCRHNAANNSIRWLCTTNRHVRYITRSFLDQALDYT